MSTLPSYDETVTGPVTGSQQYHCPCCAFYPHGLTPYSSYVTGHKFCADADGEPTAEDHTLQDKLRAIIAARRHHLRPTNLSKRAEQLADILIWILGKDYGGKDTLPVLPVMQFMRSFARARMIVTRLRDQREKESVKRNPYSQKSLRERFSEPCRELGLPVEATERIMLQFLDPKFQWGGQSRLKQVKEEEGWDTLALNLCCDAVQIIPAIARSEQAVGTLLAKIEELSKRDFPDDHCWWEFLPQVVGHSR